MRERKGYNSTVLVWCGTARWRTSVENLLASHAASNQPAKETHTRMMSVCLCLDAVESGSAIVNVDAHNTGSRRHAAGWTHLA